MSEKNREAAMFSELFYAYTWKYPVTYNLERD
jgi:hypothetical protein